MATPATLAPELPRPRVNDPLPADRDFSAPEVESSAVAVPSRCFLIRTAGNGSPSESTAMDTQPPGPARERLRQRRPAPARRGSRSRQRQCIPHSHTEPV